MNPLGPPCVLCKSKHNRCDRSKPGKCYIPFGMSIINHLYSMWRLLETSTRLLISCYQQHVSYASAIEECLLTDDYSQNSTTKADARPRTITSPDSAVLIRSSSPDPKATGKRQRADDSPDTIRNGNGISRGVSSPSQSTKTAQKPPTKRTKLTADNETEIRCQLINNINIQRSNHRNITADSLRSIIELLIQAKKNRNLVSSSDEEKEQWLEQDELMELAANKMEKGGRCSRAALTRLELFLTAPMVDEADRKDL